MSDTTPLRSFLAGAVGGGGIVFVGHPLDTIKALFFYLFEEMYRSDFNYNLQKVLIIMEFLMLFIKFIKMKF